MPEEPSDYKRKFVHGYRPHGSGENFLERSEQIRPFLFLGWGRERLCQETEGQLLTSAKAKPTPVPALTIVRKTKAKSVKNLQVRPLNSKW